MKWRTIDGMVLDPLGAFAGLETLVRGLFRRDFFLDYLRFFVLFDEDKEGTTKKIANYHQFHAVRLATERILAASKTAGDGRGGVVWHTQGSGKSISMTCLAAKIMRHPAMENPTVVVVTDRNDLDGQLFGTFAGAKSLLGETPVQADTRGDLRRIIAARPSGGIVFTTIQKFLPGEDEDEHPVLSGRHNVVVICDEAHRTQYGLDARINKEGKVQYGYAKHPRDALPNATFVAFTGTPVEESDRDTRQVFGDYVHVYDMRQAEEDGAVVPIYYESRLAKLDLLEEAKPKLDATVEELTEDEAEKANADLRRRWAELERIVGAEPRIDRIATDLVAHFEKRTEMPAGKAMVVAMSREVCVRLYDAIVKLRPEWHDSDPTKGVIKIVMTGNATDPSHLQKHVYVKDIRKTLEKRFKDETDPLRLVIVRDMWLTGFDVPCLHTLYVDKPIRAHNLMQAIARVNRVLRDKPGGLVVDYIGIAADLKDAVARYAAGGGRGKPVVDIEEALEALLKNLDVARSLLSGFDTSIVKRNALAAITGAANHVLGLPSTEDGKEGKRRFADVVLAVAKLMRYAERTKQRNPCARRSPSCKP